MLKLENISTIGIVLKGFSLEGVTGGSGTTGMYVGSTIEQTGHMMMQDVQFLNHRRGTDGGSTYTLFDSRMEKLDFYGCSEWGEFLGGSQVGHSTCTYRVCGEGVRVGSVSTSPQLVVAASRTRVRGLTTLVTSHSTPPLFARSDVIGGWMEQTVTQHIHKIVAGAMLCHGIVFEDTLFQPCSHSDRHRHY